MSSGVGSFNYETRVRDSGRQLEVAIKFPETQSCVEISKLKWLGAAESKGMDTYHPKCMYFEGSVKGLREIIMERVEMVF